MILFILDNFVSCYAWVALLKQQGIDIKGLSKGSPLNDEVPPLLEGGGKLEVLFIFFSLLILPCEARYILLSFF